MYFPWLPVGLLSGLDQFRAELGKPVIVSPADGSIWRLDPDSEHFYFRAIDIMLPEGPTLQEAYNVARGLGVFSGIGVYPDWMPFPGMHLDIRPERNPEYPALWSMLLVKGKQVEFPIQQVLNNA